MHISAKREYLLTVHLRYKSTASKHEKSAIIDEVVLNLQIARKSAIRALNRRRTQYIHKPVGKKEVYGYDLITPLKLLWQTGGCPCSKRLETQLGDLIDKLKEFQEITLYENQEVLLRKMKHTTIDRLLEGERDISRKEYGLSGTKKSPLLKTLIPVRISFSQEEYQEPGHTEMDCVLHCGNNLFGIYAETLNVLDIATHWNEKKIFLKKTKGKIVGSFHVMRKTQFPFLILSVDFDNGFEFVNWVMKGYCDREGIAFSRSRSNHKNDQAHIEGKNYHSIRKVTGYDRIDDGEIVALIDDMYQNEHRLLTNLFYTTMKLKEKRKEGGKITKIYEPAQTPYQRVIQSDKIPQDVKEKLKQQYQSLNPAALQRSLQAKLQHIQTLMNTKKIQNHPNNSVTVLKQATPPLPK